MKLSGWCAAILTVLFLTLSLSAEEKPWIEVRSPHFRLITNGDSKEARHVLRRFEQMRAVFAGMHLKVETPAPLLIIAAKDEATTRMLLPGFTAHSIPLPGGLFKHGWEREYALVRLDLVARDPSHYSSVFHEYVHTILHTNFHWLPAWLDEGMAEFFAYTEIRGDKMYIGALPDSHRMHVLAANPMVALDKFISSPLYTRDQQQTQMAYVQAWALTHFLMLSADMENGRRLQRFLDTVQTRVDQKKAFQDAFGPFDKVERQFQLYTHGLTLPSRMVAAPSEIEEKTFSVSTLGPGETDAELAAWFIRFHEWDSVKQASEAALSQGPKLALALEDVGFFLFNEGKDDEALKEFSTAIELDKNDYVALFARTMASPIARSSAAEDQEATFQSLKHVAELKPDFAPAYIELAKLVARRGELDLALALSRRAEELEPFRSGYHVLTGEILLSMNRPEEAAAQAAYVANRWNGPDRDEAMELWNRVPASHRHVDNPPETPATPADWQTAEGTIKQVSCDGGALAITLDVGGKVQTFKAHGFPVGFSDTLWEGGDHFSPCYHVQGLRAVVRYKSASDSLQTRDLIYAGYRDDLSIPKSAATHAGGK